MSKLNYIVRYLLVIFAFRKNIEGTKKGKLIGRGDR